VIALAAKKLTINEKEILIKDREFFEKNLDFLGFLIFENEIKK
jgi:magnesium-transporting ATPase (P-type)